MPDEPQKAASLQLLRDTLKGKLCLRAEARHLQLYGLSAAPQCSVPEVSSQCPRKVFQKGDLETKCRKLFKEIQEAFLVPYVLTL